MPFRALLAGLALAAAATAAEAGPFRRSVRTYYQPYYQPTQPHAYYPTAMAPAAPAAETGVTPVGGIATPVSVTEGDGLDEVNAQRAARGLRPYMRDEGLTQAARACAAFRAAHRLFGHTSNDFAFVPPGSFASSAGCAAYPAGYGWMSCCVYENHNYAGAAWVTGADGKRYMHLFVR